MTLSKGLVLTVLSVCCLGSTVVLAECIENVCVGGYVTDTAGNYGTVQYLSVERTEAYIHFTEAANDDGSMRCIDVSGPRDLPSLYPLGIAGDSYGSIGVGNYVSDAAANYGTVLGINRYRGEAFIQFLEAGNPDGSRRQITGNVRGARPLNQLTRQ